MKLQTMIDSIYLTASRAVEMGFTHEGRLFGVPAWMSEERENEYLACPKIPALQVWAIFADLATDVLTMFMTSDQVIEAPVYPTRRIGGEVSA